MHYWNKDNFEGLLAIAEGLRSETEYMEFADYCEFREKGLRKRALASLKAFIEKTREWNPSERRKRANRLLEIHFNYPEAHQLFTHPLVNDFLLPVLENWRSEMPEESAPARWLGALKSDVNLLKEAFRLDPADVFARDRIVLLILQAVDHATHHLVESRFIGDEAEIISDLEEASRLLALPLDSPRQEVLSSTRGELQDLMNDWQKYNENPVGTFPDWCKERNKDHRWWSIVYYDE